MDHLLLFQPVTLYLLNNWSVWEMKVHAVKAWSSEFQLPELWWKATCLELASVIPELLKEGRKKVVAGKFLGFLGPGNLLCAAEKKIIKEVLYQMRMEVKRNIQNCPLASRRLLGTHAHVSIHTRKHLHTQTHTHPNIQTEVGKNMFCKLGLLCLLHIYRRRFTTRFWFALL